MTLRIVLSLLCLGCLAFHLHADDKKDFIDTDTINAFAKLGASPAWISFEKDNSGKGMPGFQFERLSNGKVPKLPQVKVPFGLNLSDTRLTDQGMKELKDHKNLIWLKLDDNEVTDVGLKELKDLKDLIALELPNTKVTDAGLKDLKDLKKLTWLNLYNTKVTEAGQKELQEALPKCTIIWKTK